MQTCHENNDRADNRLVNLRWDTPKANSADRLRHGTQARGARVGNAKLTEEDVREVRRLLADGTTGMEIARLFRVSNSTVSLIKRGRTWREPVWGGVNMPRNQQPVPAPATTARQRELLLAGWLVSLERVTWRMCSRSERFSLDLIGGFVNGLAEALAEVHGLDQDGLTAAERLAYDEALWELQRQEAEQDQAGGKQVSLATGRDSEAESDPASDSAA
jgi:hypothetical protein